MCVDGDLKIEEKSKKKTVRIVNIEDKIICVKSMRRRKGLCPDEDKLCKAY
jgi:hypothetical protein